MPPPNVHINQPQNNSSNALDANNHYTVSGGSYLISQGTQVTVSLIHPNHATVTFTTTIGAGGAWSCQITVQYPDSGYTVQAAAGPLSDSKSPVEFHVP